MQQNQKSQAGGKEIEKANKAKESKHVIEGNDVIEADNNIEGEHVIGFYNETKI